MYFFVHATFENGGIKTLMLRQAQWLRMRGENVCVIGSYIDKETEQRLSEMQVKYCVIKSRSSLDVHNEIWANKDSINDVIQFFGFEEFLFFKLRNSKSDFKAFLYCVNPIDMHLGQRFKILKPILKSSIVSTIVGYSNEKTIIYNDIQTLESNIKYYGIGIDECDWRFMPLPYKAVNMTNNTIASDTISILAVARAAFPFKGYLLGLIDTLNMHIDEMPKFKLTIISAGDDVEVLKRKIDVADNKLKSVITFIEGVRAEELHKYYSNANLFIGMGTTVLEAAECGTPVIIAAPNTNQFLSEGYFHNNNKNLGGGSFKKDGWNDINYFISTSVSQREEMSQLTRRALNYYDEDLILSELYDNLKISAFRLPVIKECILKAYFSIKNRILK